MYVLYFHIFERKADQKLLLIITEKSGISCSIPGMQKFYKECDTLKYFNLLLTYEDICHMNLT